MSNLKHKSAIIFYQDNNPVLIKEGDYIEVELTNGRIKKGNVYSIDTWENSEIHLAGNLDGSLDINEVKRILLVEELV